MKARGFRQVRTHFRLTPSPLLKIYFAKYVCHAVAAKKKKKIQIFGKKNQAHLLVFYWWPHYDSSIHKFVGFCFLWDTC